MAMTQGGRRSTMMQIPKTINRQGEIPQNFPKWLHGIMVPLSRQSQDSTDVEIPTPKIECHSHVHENGRVEEQINDILYGVLFGFYSEPAWRNQGRGRGRIEFRENF